MKRKRKRYTKKECRERGILAITMSVIAAALLVGTWMFLHRELAEGHHTHISLHLVAADVIMPLLALWLLFDWVRYRRGLAHTSRRRS